MRSCAEKIINTDNKLDKTVKFCTICQLVFVLIAGVFGMVAHYTVLTGAKEVYKHRQECGNVVGYSSYGCVPFDPDALYMDYDSEAQISGDEVKPWLSHGNMVCQKGAAKSSNASDSEASNESGTEESAEGAERRLSFWSSANGNASATITQTQTCEPKPLLGCQIWVFSESSPVPEVGGKLDSGVDVEASVDTGVNVSVGRTVTDLDERCGLTEEGLIDTAYVFPINLEENQVMAPPIPMPLVWMVYKLIGLDKVFVDYALGNTGKFLQMMTFLPFLPTCSKIVSPVVSYIKFSILPVLMLSVMTSMQAVPCNDNSNCVDISEGNMLSFSRDLNPAMYMYVAIIVHTFVMMFAFAVTWKFPAIEKETDEEHFQCSEMTRVGKVLYAVLTFLDIFLLGMGLFVIMSQISRSSFSLRLIFSMAFNFDVDYSVDIFQILAALMIPVDLLSTILKKLKQVRAGTEKSI